ncbi:MAG: hypothetical protein JWP25_5594 [Bradyrhizobium sp.]|jgi:hypothetical protein|nr:hypothetical protein [Bradyrhizobium sp.]
MVPPTAPDHTTGVRQRTFVILDPSQIKNIDGAAAETASLESVDLGQRRPAVSPARNRIINARDFHLIISKKIRSRIAPRPDPTRRPWYICTRCHHRGLFPFFFVFFDFFNVSA